MNPSVDKRALAPKKKIVLIVLAVALLGGLGIVGYYQYAKTHYITTDDSRVAADLITIYPEIPGKLIEWRVKEGDSVTSNQVLGRQDLGSVLTSGAISAQTMGTVGGVFAEKAQIKAPMAGLVIESSAVVGQMATPGAPLGVIADTGNLYISANIKEDAIAHVRIGDRVDIAVDAFAGKAFHGEVETKGSATVGTFSLLPSQNSGDNYTKVTQVIPIKIRLIDAGDVPLVVGMNSTVTIHIGSAHEK
jgi:multidrug resistance efflux pump